MSTGVIFILGKGGSPILASGVKSTWPQGASAPGFSKLRQLLYSKLHSKHALNKGAENSKQCLNISVHSARLVTQSERMI